MLLSASGRDVYEWVGRTLGTELVAGEAEDDKVVAVLLLQALVESLESGELGSEAALGRRVDNQHHLACVVGEGLLVAALWSQLLVI